MPQILTPALNPSSFPGSEFVIWQAGAQYRMTLEELNALIALGLGTANQILGMNAAGDAPEWKLLTFDNITKILDGLNGITFPDVQVPSANANTLDDYEEGSFTPTIFGSTTAGVTTYTGQVGRYTKVGRLVTISIEVSWSAQTGTGSIVVGGFPFTCAATVPLTMYGSSLTFGAQVGCRIVSGNATASIITFASGGAVTNLAMDTAALVGINGAYIV